MSTQSAPRPVLGPRKSPSPLDRLCRQANLSLEILALVWDDDNSYKCLTWLLHKYSADHPRKRLSVCLSSDR